MTLEELAAQQSMYESDKYCHVCHGKLETAYYADIDSFDGKQIGCGISKQMMVKRN